MLTPKEIYLKLIVIDNFSSIILESEEVCADKGDYGIERGTDLFSDAIIDTFISKHIEFASIKRVDGRHNSYWLNPRLSWLNIPTSIPGIFIFRCLTFKDVNLLRQAQNLELTTFLQ